MTRRRTKIIATLGPASSDQTTIEQLIAAGMDVARINFSHMNIDNNPEMLTDIVHVIRNASANMGKPVTILGDLAGPKMRVTNLGAPVLLKLGDMLKLVDSDWDSENEYEKGGEKDTALIIEVSGDGLDLDAEIGDRVFLADGLVRGSVVANKTDGGIAVQITGGGTLGGGKGIHLPDIAMPAGAVTDYDERCITAGLAAGIDWFAVSFVTEQADIVRARELIKDKAGVLAKIERTGAVDDIDSILAVADGIMVARGDLGVELPPEVLPAVQKSLVTKAVEAGVVVVVATEMLESMIHNTRATRAEVSDVANAALDGASAVMLSAETAIGAHPVAAVATMARVLVETERHELFDLTLQRQRHDQRDNDDHSWSGTLAASAVAAGEMVEAETIVVVTETGATARKVAAARPSMRVVACCHRKDVAQRLGIYWGVTAITIPRYHTRHELRDGAVKAAGKALGLDDGVVVVLSGEPDRTGGIDNLRIVPLRM